MDDQQLLSLVEDVVRPSFERCMASSTEFFDDFYSELSDKAPGIGAMFAAVDMLEQNRLIRKGVTHLIDYAAGNAQAAAELQRIGTSHDQNGLNVQPELYPVWVDTLIDTIRHHDSRSDDAIDAAWRVVVRGGIDLMVARYSAT